MKNFISKSSNKNSWFRNIKVIQIIALLLTVSFMSCEKDETFYLKDNRGLEPAIKSAGNNHLPHLGNMVVVETDHMNFKLPDEIKSGWTTFRYKNNSHHTHFFLLEKMPVAGEQKDLDDYFTEVVPVFDAAMNLINAGKTGEGLAEFANLPAWSFAREFIGGVGLLGPGETGQTMQYLEPGLYVLECYVKTNGRFHTSDGMAAQVIVKEEKSKAKPPKPTMHLYVSNSGYELTGHTRPGIHTIKVHFQEQSAYNNFVGHDVNIVKIDGNSDIHAVNDWMNWVEIEGLNTPAPATFLGGVQEMPAGEKISRNTAYLTVRLEPGQQYGLVAEIPDPLSKGFFTAFTVTRK